MKCPNCGEYLDEDNYCSNCMEFFTEDDYEGWKLGHVSNTFLDFNKDNVKLSLDNVL